MKFSRRDFLRFSGLALGAALLPPIPPDESPRHVQTLGRTVKGIFVYDRPTLKGATVGVLNADTVCNIYATVSSPDGGYNPRWYQVQQGFVYSGSVQPVRWQLQTP